MLLLDQPYVSPFLRRTLAEYALPVVATPGAAALKLPPDTRWVAERTAVHCFRQGISQLLYSNSENALDWVARELPFTDLPRQIALLKSKVRFRELLAPLYPRFFYMAMPAADLAALDIRALPLPFIIKPAVGFFSLGVHKVSAPEEWPGVLATLQDGLAAAAAAFPVQVLDTTTFIIEECARGDEYAIDAYYDRAGEAVVVNVLQHPFASAGDVSDRAYISSAAIIRRTMEPFTQLLNRIGEMAGLASFPVHAEVRVSPEGYITPIEINPLRFGGWCATDIAHYAFGINPYLTFLRQERPSWERILAAKGEEITGLIVLDRSGPLAAAKVRAFDAARLQAAFSRPLEWRPIDFNRYPVFGFLFMETAGADMGEIDYILGSDLREFVTL